MTLSKPSPRPPRVAETCLSFRHSRKLRPVTPPRPGSFDGSRATPAQEVLPRNETEERVASLLAVRPTSCSTRARTCSRRLGRRLSPRAVSLLTPDSSRWRVDFRSLPLTLLDMETRLSTRLSIRLDYLLWDCKSARDCRSPTLRRQTLPRQTPFLTLPTALTTTGSTSSHLKTSSRLPPCRLSRCRASRRALPSSLRSAVQTAARAPVSTTPGVSRTRPRSSSEV